MKFPYGVADFHQLITEGYFYADRTGHIPLIEEAGKQLLFLRPRRFGKSLLLSLLEHYYDLAKADDFARLFGHLTIGRNPTPKHNQYFVLKWDFSAVSPAGTPEQVRGALHNHVNYMQAHELTLKTAFLTLLFNDLLYVMDSETTVGRRYADLTMILRPDLRRYLVLDLLLEFKYVKLSETGLSGAEVRALSAAELRALPAVQRQLQEAREQLPAYRRGIEDRYGVGLGLALRLRAYAVVAVGFERLVWEEPAEGQEPVSAAANDKFVSAPTHAAA